MYRIHRSETDTTKTPVIENNADMSALLKSGLLIKDIPRATAIAKLATVAPITCTSEYGRNGASTNDAGSLHAKHDLWNSECAQRAPSRRDRDETTNALVPVEGIEPPLLAEHDFESCASTNSATRAYYIYSFELHSPQNQNSTSASFNWISIPQCLLRPRASSHRARSLPPRPQSRSWAPRPFSERGSSSTHWDSTPARSVWSSAMPITLPCRSRSWLDSAIRPAPRARCSCLRSP